MKDCLNLIGYIMVKIYRDSETPKKKFIHFNFLGLKFRVKTYARDRLTRYDLYKDRQGIGFNFSRRHLKLYKS